MRSRLQGENDKKKTKAGRELVLRQRRNSERMKRRREKRVERKPRQGQKLGFWTAMRRRGMDNMGRKNTESEVAQRSGS